MSLYKDYLRSLITETLIAIDLYSDNAVELLMGTCATESLMGKYNQQLGGGPALGIFQMEPATMVDIFDNYLKYKPDLIKAIEKISGVNGPSKNDLHYNLVYQILLARIHYLRRKQEIPDYKDVPGLANYWKDHYNTKLGAGTPEHFIDNYKKFVA